jgi:ADP-ribose pyrophosphatase
MSDRPPHEETISSSRGFDGKLVHVRVDRVRLPSGKESVREVIEHPGAVAILALTTNDDVIFVRQWRHAVGRELLELPAGTREPGESAIETARRELQEETGFAAGQLREIARYFSSAGFLNEQITLVLAQECFPGEQKIDIDEATRVELVPVSRLSSMIEPDGELHDAKSLIGVLWLIANRRSVV